MSVQVVVKDSGARGLPPSVKLRTGPFAFVWSIFASLRGHRLLAIGLVGTIGIAAAYFIYDHGSTESGQPITVAATRGDIENLVTAIGNLQPFNTVDVGAQVSGQLKKLYVQIGDEVEKGKLVAEIDSTIAAAKVDADNAELKNLQAQLSDKQSSLSLMTIEAGRQTRLNNENATSQELYDTAQAALKSAQAQSDAVRAQITQSQSALKADEATLGYANIYAPMTGTVSAIPAKEGQTLNANQQAPTIMTISDLATVTVYTQVSEADVPKLHIGMDAYFTTLGNPNQRYSGKLRQILPTPSVVNNVVLYTALFDVNNPSRTLMSQMTAQVFFVLGAAHNVIVIPVAALKYTDVAGTTVGRGQRKSAGTQILRRPATVVVASPSGTDEARPVVVGVTNRVDAEIVSGLAPGELVIVSSQGATAAKSAPPRNSAAGGPGDLGGGIGGVTP